jgi:hypothetical protein
MTKHMILGLSLLVLCTIIVSCASDKPITQTPQKAAPQVFCQSCAMPLEKPDQFGTNADNSPNHDYCAFCYQGGKFTEPNITMQAMIDKCILIMVSQMQMPEAQAKALMENTIPRLKRWQTIK